MIHQTLTILIVDDEASIRNGLCRVIPWEELNIKVLSTAQDGFEALELIKKYKPNIVLTDIKMPGCDGLTLIQKTKELGIATKFVIISGYDDFNYARTAIRYGVKSYLLKPIKTTELMELMQELSAEIAEEQSQSRDLLDQTQAMLMGKHALKEKFLSRLLQNEFKQEPELLAELQSLNLKLQSKSLQVLVFNYEPSALPAGMLMDKNDHKLFKSNLKQTIEAVLGDNPNVTFEYQKNYIVSIINVPIHNNNINININSNSNNTATSTVEICTSCLAQIKGYSPIAVYAGIGDTVDSLLLVGDSYCNALESLSYILYETPQRIFDSSVISPASNSNLSANNMDNRALVDAIYRGSKEDLITITTAFFDSFVTAQKLPPSLIRGMCIYLVIDVQKGLSVYLEQNNGLLSEKPYLVINQLPFFSQIKEWIVNLFLEYMYYIRNSCKFRKDPVIEKAKAYIQKNIFKKLKADEVAAHVNLSENYFTVYFKEKTNENFSNYVLNLKIEHAKDILKSTHTSISEISFLLGYEDYRSFNRVFKKITGKKPSEYRQLYENAK